MATYFVWEASLEEINKKLNSLNKKAKKYGCPESSISIVREIFTNPLDPTYGNIKHKILEIELNTFDVIIDGWNFLCKLDYSYGETPVITSMNNIKIQSEWYQLPSNCDHCGINRKRNVTFLIQNENTEEIKMVGSTCLKHFFVNQNNVDKIVKVYQDTMMFILEHGTAREDEIRSREFKGNQLGYFETRYVIALALEAINKHGYIPARESSSTANYVAKAFRKGETPNQQFRLTAGRVIDFFNNNTQETGYMKNMQVILEKDYFFEKHFNMVVSAAYTYLNSQNNVQMPTYDKKWWGDVGKRSGSTFQVKRIIPLGEDDYGNFKQLIIFSQDDVFDLYWYTLVSFNFNVGDDLIMEFTVKKQTEYKGKKQTVIKRPKFIGIMVKTDDPNNPYEPEYF